MYGSSYYAAIGVFNGHLYIYNTAKLKLEKYTDNLYFTADGESFELRDHEIRYANVKYTKANLNFDELLIEIKENEHKKRVFKGSIMQLVGILYWSKGFTDAFSFLLKTIEINDFYKANLETFGNLLFFNRDIKNAKICFEKLKILDENNEKAIEMLDKIKA